MRLIEVDTLTGNERDITWLSGTTEEEIDKSIKLREEMITRRYSYKKVADDYESRWLE